MNVVLVHSGSLRLGPVPLASITIAAAVREAHFDVTVVNFDGMPVTQRSFLKKMRGKHPDVIGFSAYTMPMLERTCILTEYARKEFPNSVIVWGGVHASIFPQEVLREIPVDVVVVGEGERTFVELLLAMKHGEKDFSGIQGLVFSREGHPVVTAERAMIGDLDILPMPAWDLIDLTDSLYIFIIESRGCPFRCTFCYNKMKQNYRTKSVENVMNEIQLLHDTYGMRTFKFWDDLPFGGNKRKMIRFCDEIVRRGLKLQWSAFTRNELIDEEIISAQVAAGCIRLALGVESGSQRMLDRMNKQTTVESYIASYELMNRFPISTVASFMLGLPGETRDDLAATLDLAKRIRATEYYAQAFKVYPCTDIYEEVKDRYEKPRTIYEWARLSSFDQPSENFSCLQVSDIIQAQRTISGMTNWPKKIKFVVRAAWNQFIATPKKEIIVAMKLAKNYTLYHGKQIRPGDKRQMLAALKKVQ